MKNSKAFTLIELLVVISIISLLISILLPALGSARASGRAIQCAANMRGIGISFVSYCNAYRGYYPNDRFSVNGATLSWDEYIGGRFIDLGTGTLVWLDGKRPPSILACPSSQQVMSNGNKSNYTVNSHLFTISGSTPRADDVLNPGNTAVLVEGYNIRSIHAWKPDAAGVLYTTMGLDGRHTNGIASNDRSNTVNSLYGDGHAERQKIEELVYENATGAQVENLWRNKSPWKPKF